MDSGINFSSLKYGIRSQDSTESAALYRRMLSPLFLLLFAVFLFSARGFNVYGSCMEPNLRTGERVLASTVTYWFHTPERGDIVVFKYPADPSKDFVKRVIGLPGDVVEIIQGRLFVNGAAATEPYIGIACHGDYGPKKVADGYLFVLGDNRDASNDSRVWGELPMSNVEAKAVLRYWPMNRWCMMK